VSRIGGYNKQLKTNNMKIRIAKAIKYTIGFIGLLLSSAAALVLIGAMAALVTGSYTSVLGYLFR